MTTRKNKHRKGAIRLELGERASYRFSVLSTRQVRQMARAYLHRFGLTGNTWRVLSIIGYYGPMSASDVARRGSLEADKVTRTVDTLARRNYVIRRRDRVDRRKVVLRLSARGRRVYDEIESRRHVMERDLMGALTADEREALYRILDKLEDRADEIFEAGAGNGPGGKAG